MADFDFEYSLSAVPTINRAYERRRGRLIASSADSSAFVGDHLLPLYFVKVLHCAQWHAQITRKEGESPELAYIKCTT